MPEAPPRSSSIDQPQSAVISISDARTEEDDRPGALVRQRLKKAGCRIARYGVIGDDPTTVVKIMEALAEEGRVDAVLFNGSAKVKAKARSFEAVTGKLERRLPGFGELFRRFAYEEVGAGAMMMRGEAGLYRGMLVFAIPGTVKAAKLAMDRLIAPQIKTLLQEIYAEKNS